MSINILREASKGGVLLRDASLGLFVTVGLQEGRHKTQSQAVWSQYGDPERMPTMKFIQNALKQFRASRL